MDKKDIVDKVIEILESISKLDDKKKIVLIGPTLRVRFFMDIYLCVDTLINKIRFGSPNTKDVVTYAYDCLTRIYIYKKKLIISDFVAEVIKVIPEEIIRKAREGTLTTKDIVYLKVLLDNINMLVSALGM